MSPIDPARLRELKTFVPEQGTQLTNEEKTKKVDNDVSLIQFFAQARDGSILPNLLADPSPAKDVGRRETVLQLSTNERDRIAGDPEAFGEILREKVANDDAKTYFYPTFGELENAPSRYKFNNIVGQRCDQFENEALALARELYSGDQLDKALFHTNTFSRELRYDRTVRFDDFEMNGYGSYGHDAAFVHVYEEMLASLEQVDDGLLNTSQKYDLGYKKKQLQNEIDDIFRYKYVYHSSAMYEVNAEYSMGLCLIDRETRQRISEVEATRKTLVPAYEIMNVEHEGQNKAVFYSHESKQYFFDGSSQQVPEDLVASIVRHPVVSSKITGRRVKSGETVRKNFRFDWNGDGYVQRSKVDWVSWAGHCNDKSALESAGVVVPRGHEGVYEYDSAAGTTVHYKRDLLNEMLLSFSEMATQRSTGRASFASARDDDRPDRVVLGNGREIPINAGTDRFKITSVVKDGTEYSGPNLFSEYILTPDGEEEAEKNPLYTTTTDGDYINIGISNAVIHASAKIQVFDENSGYPDDVYKDITIDFDNPADELLLIDSAMKDPEKREMYEIYLDTQTKEWCFQLIRMVEGEDGKFTKEKIGSMSRERFDPADMSAKHETSLDNPSTWLPFARDMMTRGVNATAETADGAGVWNGRTKELGMRLVRDDRELWERRTVDVDARYGSNIGEYLVKLNKKGEEEFYVPVHMPADFWWRQTIALDIADEATHGSTAYDRGVISVQGGHVHAEAVEHMMEILHCAFNKRPYTVLHEGKRYFFETQEQWQTAVDQLEALRAAVYETGGGGGGGGAVTRGVLLDHSGNVGKKAVESFSITPEADGEMTVHLSTLKGDADLYVKEGGVASPDEHTFKSWESGLKPDKVTLAVEAGKTYGIAVHGWKASDFALKVTGPMIGEPDPDPDVEPVHFTKSGAVVKGQEDRFEIRVAKDGVLNIRMEGNGDADIYLRVGEAPTEDDWNFRPYKSGSNEGGQINVKAGDVVYGMVRGYADSSSEYNVNITSEWD